MWSGKPSFRHQLSQFRQSATAADEEGSGKRPAFGSPPGPSTLGSVDAFFADDARQRRPSPNGMGPLVATGGIYVPEEAIKPLEAELEQLSARTLAFQGEPFKWSPGRESGCMTTWST